MPEPIVTQRQLIRMPVRMPAAILLACLATAAPAAEPALSGAGAIFPFPLYATWLKQLARDPDVRSAWNSTGARIDYRATSTDAGVQALIEGDVDFAASDRSIDNAEIAKVTRGVVALPMTAGSVVLAYNLPGVTDLRLPRTIYPAIFAGRITRWDDPAIVAANPDATLPALDITVGVRADAARATDVLTAHLSAVDAQFKRDIGRAKAPAWPEQPSFMRAAMNDGVAAAIAQTPGAIGYLDYGYAKLAGVSALARLENKAGQLVSPSVAAGAASLAEVSFPEAKLPSGAADLRAQDYDPAGDAAYPITAMTWMLFYAKGYGGERHAAVRDLIDYATSDAAQQQAADLGYVPLPERVLTLSRAAAGVIAE
jgi:phosphate transport system substrate-binding protein